MSDDPGFLSPPAFKPAEALLGLRRSLRDLKLAERGAAFEFKSRRVVEVTEAGDHLAARLARRPAISPEWDERTLRSAAEVRHFLDEVRRRLGRWAQDD